MSTTPFPSERTAVVTGAGAPRGIGRHVARALAASGWNVAVLDIDESAVTSFASELAEESGRTVVGV